MYLDFDAAVWAWPQWAIFSSYMLSVFVTAFLHGNKRTGEYSFPVTLVTSAVGVFILTAGGFFGAA